MSTALITRPVAVHTDCLLEPTWAEITDITKEVEGVSTYWFQFTDPAVREAYSFRPGQFNMVYVPGFGEAAISISSDSEDHSRVGHTIRFVGNVTRAVSRLRPRDLIGLRAPVGPGSPWQLLPGMVV